MSDDVTPKLGEMKWFDTLIGPRRHVCTTVERMAGYEIIVWSPVPDGMEANDLGRKFTGAFVGRRFIRASEPVVDEWVS